MLAGGIMDKEQATIVIDLKQMPVPEQPQAVVIATLENGMKKSQGIGAAAITGRDAAYDPQALIDKAIEQAISRAYSLGYPKEATSVQKLTGVIIQAESASAIRNSSKFKHKSEPGSISDKQFTMLERMAQERNQSFEDMAKQMFNAKPAELSSQQAQAIFDHLKDTGKKYE